MLNYIQQLYSQLKLNSGQYICLYMSYNLDFLFPTILFFIGTIGSFIIFLIEKRTGVLFSRRRLKGNRPLHPTLVLRREELEKFNFWLKIHLAFSFIFLILFLTTFIIFLNS